MALYVTKKCETYRNVETTYTRVYWHRTQGGNTSKGENTWMPCKMWDWNPRTQLEALFFVITATGIGPRLTVRQLIKTSKCGRFYALQFIFNVPKWGSSIMLQVKMIWKESLMSDRKTESKIWIFVVENDSDPEVCNHILMR